MNGRETLQGRRVLLVEDEYLIACEIVVGLRNGGAVVVGPVGCIDDALDLIDRTQGLDGAILDVNLRGEMAYPVADVLIQRRVPLVFMTGYDEASIPARYRTVTRCEKPVALADIARALFG
ncbi:MAG TPA: response regulator [Xanthobacteraceae bacterium]|jgi:CheY-like chemotaxis protein|nr:response regulator [Xanthobacteraceae bacterium]